MLGDLDWHRFANGDFVVPVRVCRLSVPLVKCLGASDDRVLLHPQYAPKFVEKHHITPRQMLMMPLAVEFGTVLQDRDKTLSFFYEDDIVFGKIFHLAVKTTGHQHEIWVRTFHKVTVGDMNRRLRRGQVLRQQV